MDRYIILTHPVWLGFFLWVFSLHTSEYNLMLILSFGVTGYSQWVEPTEHLKSIKLNFL